MADTQESLFQRSANVYRLHELVDSIVAGVGNGSRFVFDATLLKRLHRVAADGLLDNNGDFRNHGVAIRGSPHRPPPWIEVDTQVDSMCRYVTDNWDKLDLVQLAAFVMWRLNWIHPFSDGNGRTSRASSYLVLCAKHGRHLPGQNTVLVQIGAARDAYCKALRDCDDIYAQTGSIEGAIEPLVRMLTVMLITQLEGSV